MTKKTTLTLFYGAIALLCIGIILLSRFLHRANEAQGVMPGNEIRADGDPAKPYEFNNNDLMHAYINPGKEVPEVWFELEKDLKATNQLGEEVSLFDLRGKVVLVANFFAVCPMCAQRNGEELYKIYEAFRDDPDFHVVCISVDPENDDVAKLKSYGEALNADPSNWWFLNAGSEEDTHRYLEQELKFFKIEERTDPLDIEANGRFAHDLGFILLNRDLDVVGKWPLSYARTPEAKVISPNGYERLKKQLFERIERELAKKP
ncbi:MAG: SCO family protein [Akkermansiaceae bacterium]|nr:SCO family protein [Akkermansiaceae bacterium]